MYGTEYNANHRLMSAEEELECLVDYQFGCPTAANKLVELNMRLVGTSVKKYGFTKQAAGIDLKDLVQEGIMGLCHAADKFDTDRKLRFSTYCVAWIDQTVRRFVMNHSKTIRVPVHLYAAASKINGIRQEHGFETYEDIMEQLHKDYDAKDAENAEKGIKPVVRIKISEKSFKELPGCMMGLSLNESDMPQTNQSDDEMDRPFLDTCHDTSVNVEASAEDEVRRKTLAWFNEVLEPREVQVLVMRTGLGVESKTLDEVGVIVDLTRERVRQIQNAARLKLKGPWAQSISPLGKISDVL